MNGTIIPELANGAVIPDAPARLNIFALLVEAGGVVWLVLALLFLLSLVSWFIIGTKLTYLRKARQQTTAFMETFWQSKKLDTIYKATDNMPLSPIAQVFRGGYTELMRLKAEETKDNGGIHGGGAETIDRALTRTRTAEMNRLEKMIPFLATTATAAPFIGLFGTVWGIMNAFINIGAQHSASLATVAPGIAEALITTAVGLAAAIPAVVAYNYFIHRLRLVGSEMESFSSDFTDIVKRHFLK